jgi:hypothetical protein
MSLDVGVFLKDYLEDMKSTFPEFAETLNQNYGEPLDSTAECTYFSEIIKPRAMKIIQKDESLFAEPFPILRGVDISTVWSGLGSETQESLWKYIRMSLAYSFLGGDSETQIQSLLGMFKTMWSEKTGKSEDEIDGILNDERTQSSMQDLLESFSKSKIAALLTEMIETIRPEQLGLDQLNITDIAQIGDILKNPDNPILQRASNVIKEFLDRKMANGSLTKDDLIREIEGFKAQLTGKFGNLLKETLLGEEAGNRQSAAVLMGNSPEARRARMLVRLQKKHREKSMKK